MAFTSGKSGDVYVNGQAVHDLLKNITVSSTVDSHDSTVFHLTEHTYVPGLINATLSADGFADLDVNLTNQIALLTTNNTVWTVFPWTTGGTFIGGIYGYGFLALYTAIEQSAPVDDIVTMSLAAQSNVGIEHLRMYAYQVAEPASANGDIIDNGAATTNGGVAYLQFQSANAGTTDVTLRHSTDNFGADDTLLASFTQRTTTPAGERITFAGNVKRYVRAVWTMAGGATSATFLVGVKRG